MNVNEMRFCGFSQEILAISLAFGAGLFVSPVPARAFRVWPKVRVPKFPFAQPRA
jgi:hypothetical protein